MRYRDARHASEGFSLVIAHSRVPNLGFLRCSHGVCKPRLYDHFRRPASHLATQVVYSPVHKRPQRVSFWSGKFGSYPQQRSIRWAPQYPMGLLARCGIELMSKYNATFPLDRGNAVSSDCSCTVVHHAVRRYASPLFTALASIFPAACTLSARMRILFSHISTQTQPFIL